MWYWLGKITQPVSDDTSFKDFVIQKGTTATQVGRNLKEAGLVQNAFVFKFYVQLTGMSGKIQSGEYRLSPSYSLSQIVAQFLKGPVEIWVTIPEGLRREEVAVRFSKTLEKDSIFVEDFLSLSRQNEGKLFPDTYLFPKDASASSVVNKMVNTFDSKTKELSQGNDLGFNELLTLASLLERETITDAERPVVAGIILKRLEAGWPLQIDAAVQFAVAGTRFRNQDPLGVENWWPILTREDLEINSPYNTYKFGGLPPGPIASPGLASLKAAWNPEESEYWYYIHDNDGKIHYGRTLDEHNANIAKYLGK